jgi:hypothetical protein
MGMDIDTAHESMVKRLNSVQLIHQNKIDLPVEISYTILALIAAGISFAIVKININFAYYFFLMSKTFSSYESDEVSTTKEEGSMFNLSQIHRMIYIALLTPLLISFLFIDELAYGMLNGLVSK